MKEFFKDIPNFDGYQASNLGNIYSKKTNKILKVFPNKKGYLRTNLFINKKPSSQKVHRLVAYTFLPNPNNYKEINHKDGNKLNNCVDNLEWCNRLYNMQEAFKNSLIPPRKVNRTSYQPVKVEQYDLNYKLLNSFSSIAEASKKTGYKVQAISRYCKNQRKCKDYIWKYANK